MKEGRRGSLVANQRGSVRDMIASLNKPEKGDGATKPRKGNSLPRNNEGLVSQPAKSPGLKAKTLQKASENKVTQQVILEFSSWTTTLCMRIREMCSKENWRNRTIYTPNPNVQVNEEQVDQVKPFLH